MIGFFVRKHSAVFSFSVLIIIVGILSYRALPREAVPEIKRPWIFVTTVYPGVGAKDVENLVTRVIEDEIDGLEGISTITSSSQQSLSFIHVEFTSDVSVEAALRRVRERVDIAKGELPEDVDEPLVQELSFSSLPIFVAVLSHPDGLAVIDQASEMVRDELKRVKGVLDVKLAGNLTKEVAIELDPLKLEHYGLTMNQVMGAIAAENVNIPGGTLKSAARTYSIAVTGEIRDASLFEEIVVKANGMRIPLRELGTVSFDWAEPETYSRINGQPCISLSMTKRSGQNIIDIVDESKALIEKLKSQLPSGTEVAYSYDESQDIRDLVSDLENNIYTGLLLVLLVTLLFLGPVNALFVSLAIPFSMLMSFFVLDLMGITLNMVVLFSLVMALGMLVDNGIVIVENIFRHASLGKSRRQASIDGSKEVAWPIITSTLTTCLAFFPLIFMPGIMGDFMAYLPITVIIVLTCSLIVALTINPVFCASFMKISESNMKRITEGSGLFVRFQQWYERQVRWSVKRPWKVLGISAVVVFSGIILYGLIGREPIFFPYLDPEDAIVSLEMSQGTPLDSTDHLVRQLEQMVADVPASLDNYQATTGRATGDVFSGIGEEQHKANIRVSYRPFIERTIKGQVALDSLKQRLGAISGAIVKVEEGQSGPPTGNDISYQITGSDYAVMGAYADSLVAILKTYPEFKLVDTDYEPAKPEISVDIDRAKAAFYKLSTQEIAAAVRNSINGATVGSFRLDEDEYDIVMRYQNDSRNSINHLSALQIVNNDDGRIPLSSVASIGYNSSVGTIKRQNLQRAVGVWADFRPDVERKTEITQEIAHKVKGLAMPAGYRVQDGQGAEDRQESVDFLLKAFVIALFLIMAVLIAQFNSVVDTLIIMLTVLLSFGGVFWGYLITGEQFVIIMSGIGCIALTGVVVNNCIVLIDYMHLLIRQGMPWEDAVIEAGRTRLRPVLLTAITTVLGMLPMVLGVSFDFHIFRFQFGSDSTQMWKAFAMAMVTGLSFATIMTLVLVPVLMTLRYRYLPPKKGLDA